MYNRYIGNTGKVLRVEEEVDRIRQGNKGAAHEPPPRHDLPHKSENNDNQAHRKDDTKKPSLFGGGGLKFLDGILPFGLDTSDLVLLVLFLFLFIESGDEEFLIILGFLAYSMFKDHKDEKKNE